MISDESYMQLIGLFPLRPIRHQVYYDTAMKIINHYSEQVDLDKGEHDYLDVLRLLANDFEESEIQTLSGVEALAVLMKQKNLSQIQLSHDTEIPTTTINEILMQKRGISPKIRKKLADYFQTTQSMFL